jgi:hypothetical protein
MTSLQFSLGTTENASSHVQTSTGNDYGEPNRPFWVTETVQFLDHSGVYTFLDKCNISTRKVY